MKVIDITEVKLEWQDITNRVVHPRPAHKRSPGVHVSGILKYIAVELGLLKPGDEVDEMPLVVMLGMAFEEWAVGLYPRIHWQPKPLRLQGINGSMDGLMPINHLGVRELVVAHERFDLSMCVEEFKFTYKSCRKRHDNITNEWMWMNQIMAYLNMFHGQPKTAQLGRLHVLWNLNDYKYPLQPKYYRYLIRFEAVELRNNWSLLQKYKDKAVAE